MGRDAKYSKLKVASAVLEDDASLAAFSPATSDDREAMMNLSVMAADLAGIADAILTNRNLPEEHKAILKHDVLRGSRLQLCLLKADEAAPTEIDLTHLPDVLEHARNLEKLRKACFEIVFGTRH